MEHANLENTYSDLQKAKVIPIMYSMIYLYLTCLVAAAKNTLAERQERDLEMLENARQEIAELTEEKKLFIMGLNNTLANLRVTLVERYPLVIYSNIFNDEGQCGMLVK